MSTAFSFPVSIFVAGLILTCFMPLPSSAIPRDFFSYRNPRVFTSATPVPSSTTYSSRGSTLTHQSSLGSDSQSTAAAVAGSAATVMLSASSGNPNSKAIRGVRKLLFGTMSCAPHDLSLTQGPVSSASGIPTFNVQIVNLCGACAMKDIHVACGNWASATPVDPYVFTRLGYNDCLVNNGRPLNSQGSVSFQYSNSAMYPMSIATATNKCA
ncbi:hypothetical protein R1flu_029026 [Riccia fluitans]|uniref:Uncharacterized protein n=1 Tax=Riccia fluitans TaxID=41844 RepID=A0ABD1XSF4_9MARC